MAIIFTCLFLFNKTEAQSWQFSKKLGCDKKYTANDEPRLLSKLKDSKGNHYLYYYITGDTFYYDGFSHKRYLRGGDGYALCKIRCDGSLAWFKIFTHDKKSQAILDDFYNDAAIFFGDDENRIVVSGKSYTEGTNFYVDTDTTVTNDIEYTIVYDSIGNTVKKIVGKPRSLGRSRADGYFPQSHRYFFYSYIDSSATDRTFFNGKYLQWGEYFIVMDSNMNYLYVSPVTLFSKSRFTWEITQPGELTFERINPYQYALIGNKAIILNWSAFRPQDPIHHRYVVVGRDSFKQFDNVNTVHFNVLMCYNDTGGQEWTKFPYSYISFIDNMNQDKNEIFMNRDQSGVYYYQQHEINGSLSIGREQLVIFKIDSNGNFLWKDSLEHGSSATSVDCYPDVSYNSELTFNYNLYSDIKWSSWVKVGDIQYHNNTLTPSGSSYTKNLIVAVGKGTQRVIDTTKEGIRRTLTSHVSVDAANNVWLFGSKEIDGHILDNDSTPLQYGTGNDLFIAKHGRSFCYCDPLVSSYLALDTSIEGQIKIQYTGTATDSVVYLWGDGTHTVAKPSHSPVTKIYNKTIAANIAAIAYNECYRTDTFRRTYQIRCTPPNAAFVLLDSNTKNLRIKFVGTTTDTVMYHWGDGNTTKLANPLNKITNYNYTTSVDSVYISAIVKSICGDRDTFGRWYVFCPKPKKTFILDTSTSSMGIVSIRYTGTDSLWVHWGDGMVSYKPSGIKIYNSYGVYTISVIIKSSCGRLDTTKYTLTIGISSIENNRREDIIVSPNPVIDKCTIEGIYPYKPIEFTIYDLMGKIVLQGKTTGAIDLSTLSNGNYILTLLNEKCNHVVKRIEVRR